MSEQLTIDEIDAMAALVQAANKTNWVVDESFEVLRAARTFIPKAIAALREKNEQIIICAHEYRAHIQRIRDLEEQTRWRHIDQEQPEHVQVVIVWLDGVSVSFNYDKEKNTWGYSGNILKIGSQDFAMVWDAKLYPYWQPLPTKGPDET